MSSAALQAIYIKLYTQRLIGGLRYTPNVNDLGKIKDIQFRIFYLGLGSFSTLVHRSSASLW